MSLKPALKNFSREEKAELYSLVRERERRKIKANAFNSYAGFIKQFSDEPEPAFHHKYLIEKLDAVREDLEEQILHLLAGEGLLADRAEAAVHPDLRGHARRDVEVRAPLVAHHLEELIDLRRRHALPTSGTGRDLRRGRSPSPG